MSKSRLVQMLEERAGVFGVLRLVGSVLIILVPLTACSAGSEEDVKVVAGGLHARALQTTASPTVCWVKDDDSTTSDADFDAATQLVQDVMSQWEQASGLRFVWQGRCGAPVNGAYQGDIRILWNEMSRDRGYAIPGTGCGKAQPGWNWGGYPGTYPAQCRWNAGFATAQPINNYLHESGHTLGFLHEHVRSDTACGSDTGPDKQLLTPYDALSVMHYVLCDSPGNGDDTGLSDLDELGVEIAYPKSPQTPIAARGGMAYSGGVVFRTDQGGSLQPAWFARGALSSVFGSFRWTLGSSVTSDLLRAIGGSLGSSPVLATMQFTDPFGRSRTGSTQVRTSNSAHAAMVAATIW